MIRNLTKKTVIAGCPWHVLGFRLRARGMIGRVFDGFDAMVFDHCASIHSCFMSIPLDVIFVGRDFKILKTVVDLRPWTLFVYCKNAFYVIELPVGTISRCGCECGDMVDMETVMDARTEENFRSTLLAEHPQNAVQFEREG